MEVLSWSSIAFYCLLNIFVFYQQLHIKNFRGGSHPFALALNISAFAGMLAGLAYLVYYGWSVAWWAPFLIFIIGLLSSAFGFLLERIFGSWFLSMGGFIGWPVSAYLMFRFMPSAI
jgi:hypothetical protein